MAVLLIAAGCAGGDQGARGSASCVNARHAAADIGSTSTRTTLAIATHDDRFEPACIELDAVGPVTLVVRNIGRHPHNLTLEEGPSVSVDAGQVGLLELDIGDGRTPYVCTIHPGMDGEIRVRP